MINNTGKGISPVIASILLILIVISLASAFLVFTGRLSSDVSGEAEEQVTQARELATSSFTIQSVKDQRVFVRNTGGETIDTNAFIVTLGDTEARYTQDGPIEPGESGVMAITNLWEAGPGERTLRLEGAVNSQTETVRVEPADGAVLDMRFEEGFGETANDFSGSGNDGLLENGAMWARGRMGGGVEMPVNNDQVFVSDSSSLSPESAFTVATWVRSSDWQGAASRMFIQKGINDEYQLQVVNDSLSGGSHKFNMRVGDVSDEGTDNAYGEETPEDNTWYYVVGVFDGSQVRLYVDGVLVGDGTRTESVTPTDEHVRIGWGGAMLVDEVLVYTRAYTPEELYVMAEA